LLSLSLSEGWKGMSQIAVTPRRANTQTPYQLLEIAYTIPICIHEVAYRKAIDHRVLVPKIIDHCDQTSPIVNATGLQ
jgi:hypothetical protein